MIIEGFSLKFIKVFKDKYVFIHAMKDIMTNHLFNIEAKDDC